MGSDRLYKEIAKKLKVSFVSLTARRECQSRPFSTRQSSVKNVFHWFCVVDVELKPDPLGF
jgi:hypothetical protein